LLLDQRILSHLVFNPEVTPKQDKLEKSAKADLLLPLPR